MIHWSADSYIGPPVAPYVVELAYISDKVTYEKIQLGGGAPYQLRFLQLRDPIPFHSAKGSIAFVQITTTQAATLYAIDEEAVVIPGSRTRLPAGESTFFFGSRAAGIGSDDPTEILMRFSFGDDLTWSTLGEVAPTLQIGIYGAQIVGSSGLLSPVDALAQRRALDSAALQGIAAPQKDLQNLYDSGNEWFQENRVLSNEAIVFLEGRFTDVVNGVVAELKDNTTSHHLMFQPSTDGTTVDVDPLDALQLMAVCGPFEASALGHGLSTEPIDADGPWPRIAVRVTGYFAKIDKRFSSTDAHANRQVATKYVGYAALIGPPRGALFAATESPIRPPQERDSDATLDVKFATHDEVLGLESIFLERDGKVLAHQPTAATPEPWQNLKQFLRAAPPESGTEEFIDENVPLNDSLDDTLLEYNVYRRDEFGRWAPVEKIRRSVSSWPPSAPVLERARPIYHSDMKVDLEITFAWPWGVRTPKSIEVVVGHATKEIATLVPIATVLDFDVNEGADILPSVRSGRARCSFLDKTPVPEATLADYKLVIALGAAADLFLSDQPLPIVISATGTAKRSGDRVGLARPLFLDLADPRPPVLKPTNWPLIWASHADTNRVARAALPFPEVESSRGPSFDGVFVWRAHESRLMQLVQEEFGTGVLDDLRKIRAQRDMHIRRSLLVPLVQAVLAQPNGHENFARAFAADSATLHVPKRTGTMEMELPGDQVGLEFVAFTAISKSTQSSEKTKLHESVLVVAVPRNVRRPRPTLTVIATDDAGLFEVTGNRLLVLTSPEPFESSQVRLFRDDIPQTTGDAVLLPLEDFEPLTLADARGLVATIDQDIEAIGGQNPKLFLARLPQRWQRSFIAAELRGAGSDPSDEVASPRSNVVSSLVLPVGGPRLVATQLSDREWNVQFAGTLPLVVDEGLPSSEIYISFEVGAQASTFGPLALAEFSQPQTITLPNGGVPTTAVIELEEVSSLAVITTAPLQGSLTLTGRDPSGRFGSTSLGNLSP